MAIAGLAYVPDFISEPEEAALLAAIDTEPWLDDLKRRVQHYGFRYDYKARKIDSAMRLGPLPDWAEPLALKLKTEGHMPEIPDQLIINEYEPGQGISAHVDCVPCFGPVICSLTLGSSCAMELTEVDGAGVEQQFLERRSLVSLSGSARYQWRHAIPGRKSDKFGGQTHPRGRRVSLTFRTVIVSDRNEFWG